MVRKLFSHIFPLALVLVTGCTVATPNISSLSEFVAFSSKSKSPFNQENMGGVIYFSGQCLPQVTGFEYRLNNLPIWNSVPTTPPTPGVGEYLVGTPTYDVDCSDGEFNFYVFESDAMANFTLNSTTSGPGDPSVIELRTIGIDNLPSLVFQRPTPSAFVINYAQYNIFGYLEVESDLRFSVRLLDTDGHQSMLPSGQSINMTITPTDLQNPLLSAGDIYENDCTTPVNATDTTFNPGDDEIQLCYKATGTTAEHMIKLEISAAGMLPAIQYITIKPADSVVSQLSAPASSLPRVLLKGVDYNLNMGLHPLYFGTMSRYVSSFSGIFQISSSDSNATFVGVSSDPECPATPQSGSMSCTTTTSSQKPFILNVNQASTASSITLNLTATPDTSCVNCYIWDSSTYPITDYLSNSLTFTLASGSTSYNQPYVNLMGGEQYVRLSQCHVVEIGQANDDGVIIPASAMNYTITYSGGGIMQFYPTYDDCVASVNYTSTTSLTFATNDLIRFIYLKVNSLPTNGTAILNINDGSNSFNKSFYIKSN